MDFRNALVPNDNVNLYCASLSRSENAYAIVPTAAITATIGPTSGSQLYSFRNLTSPVRLLGITQNLLNDTFTITKKGVYSVFCSMNTTGIDSGSQSKVALFVDGSSTAFNVIFPNGYLLESCLTLVGSVECDGVSPKTVSVEVSYLQGTVPVNSGEFRYGQLSITKLSD